MRWTAKDTKEWLLDTVDGLVFYFKDFFSYRCGKSDECCRRKIQ